MGLNVFLIDRERTFANALAARLEAEDDIDVVLAVHRQAPAPSLIVGRHADVVLLDADLPGDAAVRLCEELSGRADAPRVVMLSRGSEASRIADAVRAGAAGWVRKGESLAYLLQVIRGVAEGETWLSPAETGAVLRLLMQEEKQQRDSDRLLASLTPRERGSSSLPGRRRGTAGCGRTVAPVRQHGTDALAEPHGQARRAFHAGSGGSGAVTAQCRALTDG